MKVSARELVTRLETAKKIVPVEATFAITREKMLELQIW